MSTSDPQSAPSPAVVAAIIEDFLRRLCSGAEANSMSEFVGNNLSFSQVRVMMTLACFEAPMQINQIASQLGMTLASAGRNVEFLVREGFVERTEDPRDRRVKLVHLAGAGEDLIARHFECHRTSLSGFVDRLSPHQRTIIAEALGPILEEGLLPSPGEVTGPAAQLRGLD